MGIFDDDEDDYIERNIIVNGKKINAKYSPDSGRFAFGKPTKLGYTDTSPTKAGAFQTMRALVECFSDVNPRKICYTANGATEREAEVKDRFYSRELSRLGYKQVSSGNKFRRSWLTTQWSGPERIWLRKRAKDKSKK